MINRLRRQLVGGVVGNGDSIGLYVNRYDDIVADFGVTVGKKYLQTIPASPVLVVDADVTLTKDDNGKTIVFDDAATIVATLPSAAECKGCRFRFAWLTLATSGVGHSVSPVAADGVGGGVSALTTVVDKDVINAEATDTVADRLEVTSTGASGTGAWVVTEAVGTFSKEA